MDKLFDISAVSVAENNDVAEEVVVRFSNSQLPQRAGRNKNNLAAVCCPAYSLGD